MNENVKTFSVNDQSEQTYRAIREGFQYGGSDTSSLNWMVIFTIALIVGIGVFWWLRRRRELAAQGDALERAFLELGLGRSERILIRKLARLSEAAQPVALLLSPANLAWGVLARRELREDETIRRQIHALSWKLFGQDVELTTPSAESHRHGHALGHAAATAHGAVAGHGHEPSRGGHDHPPAHGHAVGHGHAAGQAHGAGQGHAVGHLPEHGHGHAAGTGAAPGTGHVSGHGHAGPSHAAHPHTHTHTP